RDITVVIRLTIAGCPMQDTIHNDVATALARVTAGEVSVRLTSMTPEQRVALQETSPRTAHENHSARSRSPKFLLLHPARAALANLRSRQTSRWDSPPTVSL